MPVVSNVPSRTDTRGSVTALLNTLRMPALGSTARSSFMADDQSGLASNARVKMPVPAPILNAKPKPTVSGQSGEGMVVHLLYYIEW